jgi:hypothetical protein
MKHKLPTFTSKPLSHPAESLRTLDITPEEDGRGVKIILNGREIRVGLNMNYPNQLVITADDTILVRPCASNQVTVRVERDKFVK